MEQSTPILRIFYSNVNTEGYYHLVIYNLSKDHTVYFRFNNDPIEKVVKAKLTVVLSERDYKPIDISK